MIDPKVHLKGATPEELARALLRNLNPALRPGGGEGPVAGNKGAEREVPSNERGYGVPHLQPTTPDLALEALRRCGPDCREGMPAVELRDRMDAAAVAERALHAFRELIDPRFLHATRKPA